MGPNDVEEVIVNTDEAILESIGEGDDKTADDDATQASTEAKTDDTGATSPVGDQQGTDDSDATKQPAKAGSPQDLRDKDGNIVATGGKERRFYETAQKFKSENEQLTTKVTSLEAQLKAVNDAGNLGTQYSLTPEELTTGAQLISAYKKSPVETIQYMLTQTQASGHNIDAISSGGTDMSAVKQMLDNALAPLVAERQQRVDTQEASSRATTIYNNFVAKFPDAVIHQETLAQLLNEDSELTPEAAYYKLRASYYDNNLDWTKPLATLRKERDDAKASADNFTQQQQLPDGGGAGGNVVGTDTVASVHTSTDDIIRQAMAEAGIT